MTNPVSKQRIRQLVEDSFAKVDSGLDYRPAIEEVPVADLVRTWFDVHGGLPRVAHPTLHAPASTDEIDIAERRLGIALPAALRDFYQFTNGITWAQSPGEYLGPAHGRFPRIDELCVGRNLVPPLSELLSRQAGSVADDERPSHVEVFSPRILALVEPPERMFEFSALDAFLVLRWPSTSSACLLMSHDPGLPFPVGTVLEIENFTAVHFVSLRHWLSANASLYG